MAMKKLMDPRTLATAVVTFSCQVQPPAVQEAQPRRDWCSEAEEGMAFRTESMDAAHK